MSANAERKQENPHWLRLHRVERTPDEVMVQENKRRVYGLKIAKGSARPRRFHKVVADELFPLASISKLTDDAVAAGCDETAFAQAILVPVRDMIRAKFRKQRAQVMPSMDTGEFRPAA